MFGNKRKKAENLVANGSRGVGTITDILDTGMTVNDNPRVRLRFRVEPLDGSTGFDAEKTQTVSRAFGPVATPHVFIFDSERKLRYEGRVDDNPREAYATRQDARLALDEILAGKPVEKPHTPAVGCSTKWIYKEKTREEAIRKIESQPVTIKSVTADDLKSLRRNSSGKVLLVDFWATWCGPCLEEMPAFETMFRMYGHRKFDFVTVSVNYPDEKEGVLRALNQQHATTTNLLFGSTKIYDLMAAFDPSWNAAVPYTVLLSPTGDVLYNRQGPADALELRRLIVANVPDDDYKGLQAYWRQAVYPDQKQAAGGQE